MEVAPNLFGARRNATSGSMVRVLWPITVWLAVAPAAAQTADAPAVEPAASVADSSPDITSDPPKPMMGSIVVHIEGDGVPIFIDGESVGTSPLPGPWFVRPGSHEVEARASGSESEQSTVQVTAGGTAQVSFDIAVKAPVTVEVEVPEPTADDDVIIEPAVSLATIGWVAAGFGTAAGVASVVFGLQALSSADEAESYDRRDADNSREGLGDIEHEGERAAFLSNITLGVAITGLALGGAMLFLASDGPFADEYSLVPTASGAIVGGRF